MIEYLRNSWNNRATIRLFEISWSQIYRQKSAVSWICRCRTTLSNSNTATDNPSYCLPPQQTAGPIKQTKLKLNFKDFFFKFSENWYILLCAGGPKSISSFVVNWSSCVWNSTRRRGVTEPATEVNSYTTTHQRNAVHVDLFTGRVSNHGDTRVLRCWRLTSW